MRSAVYLREFGFSNSIKSVAPALAPEFGYDDLQGVADGLAASGAFLQLASRAVTVPEEIDDLRSQLLAYCERDTLAMIELLNPNSRRYTALRRYFALLRDPGRGLGAEPRALRTQSARLEQRTFV